MPNILIATRTDWIDSADAVVAALRAALLEGLGVPAQNCAVRLIEHPPSHFPSPPGHGPRFTLVEITLLSGRSAQAKAKLYQSIVGRLQPLGLPPQDVKIVLIEAPAADWGVGGGLPASTVDYTFKIDI